jgi:hypothetical protein
MRLILAGDGSRHRVDRGSRPATTPFPASRPRWAAVEGRFAPPALSRPTDACLRCGGETRLLPDALEALSRAVIEAGGSVEHVMTETRLAEDLVAARLRFALW